MRRKSARKENGIRWMLRSGTNRTKVESGSMMVPQREEAERSTGIQREQNRSSGWTFPQPPAVSGMIKGANKYKKEG